MIYQFEYGLPQTGVVVPDNEEEGDEGEEGEEGENEDEGEKYQ